MKDKIHPKYYAAAKVTCSCGHIFTAGSTKPEIQVEICSKCHPFFTGEMRFVDTQGRVEKFQAKQASAKARGFIKKKDRKAAKEQKEKEKPRTFKEMLSKKSK